MCEVQFALCLGQSGPDVLFAVGAAPAKSAFQNLQARRYDEERQGVLAEIFFQVHATFYVDVEDDDLSVGPNALDFRFEGAVEAVLIDLLVLYECILSYQFSESFGA